MYKIVGSFRLTILPVEVIPAVAGILDCPRVVRPRVEVDDLHLVRRRLQRDRLERRGPGQLRDAVPVLRGRRIPVVDRVRRDVDEVLIR